MSRKLISIVIPVYGEQGNVVVITDRIEKVFKSTDYEVEIIFVNDGSSDNSQQELEKLCEQNKIVKCLEFSRNFGNQIAVSAGIDFAKGDAVITMDCDLQHPPEVLMDFLKRWEEGFEIVLSRRINHKHSYLAKLFFWLISKVTNIDLGSSVSDFRLLDKKVCRELRKFTEKERFVRGIIAWIGFKKTYLDVEIDERLHGKSKFSNLQLFRLGLSSLKSFSYIPLKLGLIIGLFIFIVSSILLVYMLVDYYFIGYLHARPTAFFAVLNSVMLGFILIIIGMIGEYLQSIHHQVQGRPLYILRDKYNIDEF